MDLLIIGLTALLASGLTFFSGFGLGTILMPVFALFFPVPLAVAATAVVHLANNLFKVGLMAKQANWKVVALFSMPATLTAMMGASLLTAFDQLPVLASYSLGGSTFEVTVVKSVIGILIMAYLGALTQCAVLVLSPTLVTGGWDAVRFLWRVIGKPGCTAVGLFGESRSLESDQRRVHARCPPRRNRRVARASVASAWFGTGDIGSIASAMRMITHDIAIMSVGTRSSMGWLPVQETGRTRVSAASFKRRSIPPTGELKIPIWSGSKPESDDSGSTPSVRAGWLC